MIKIVEGILPSELLQREIPYRVILPEKYGFSQKRYPVLYLLHGLFGNCTNWLELTDLREYASAQELIIVLPEGSDGWYTDSETVNEDRFESYFIEELIPEIEAFYKTHKKREQRAVAGLSMGGYGALKFGFRRPDLFAFAGSISGAFDAPLRTEKKPGFNWEDLGPSILKTFGTENSQTRTENDLFQMTGQMLPEKIRQLPEIYIDCGTADGFLEINRKLAERLREKKIKFEYHELPGGHDWAYWDNRIRYLLPILAPKLKPEENR